MQDIEPVTARAAINFGVASVLAAPGEVVRAGKWPLVIFPATILFLSLTSASDSAVKWVVAPLLQGALLAELMGLGQAWTQHVLGASRRYHAAFVPACMKVASVAVAGMFVYLVVYGLFVRPSASGREISSIHALASVALGSYLAARTGLSVVGAAVGRPITLRQSWDMTPGMAGVRLAFTPFLVTFPLYLLTSILVALMMRSRIDVVVLAAPILRSFSLVFLVAIQAAIFAGLARPFHQQGRPQPRR